MGRFTTERVGAMFAVVDTDARPSDPMRRVGFANTKAEAKNAADELNAAIDALWAEITAVAEAAYVATYAGPWGLKASEEDAVLSVLAALYPGRWTHDAAGIDRFRARPELGKVASDLFEDWSVNFPDVDTPEAWVAQRIADAVIAIEGAPTYTDGEG